MSFKKVGLWTDSRDSHLGKYKLTLEGFSLSFASPQTQNQRNLNTQNLYLLTLNFITLLCKYNDFYHF